MANKYSQQERCRIAALMNVHNSTSKVRRIFSAEFNTRPPTHLTIRRINEKFLETGSISNRKYKRKCTSSDEINQIRVQAHFDENATSSIRQAAIELSLTPYAVRQCLRKVTLKSFRITSVHGLRPTDYQIRVHACNVLAEMAEITQDITSRIVFSDEATFHVSGVVNSSTCRIWAYENPHAAYEHHRESPKVNVWCGITSTAVIGPFFFAEKTIHQFNFLDMLENYAVPIIRDLGIAETGYFMLDGAPAHWSRIVRDYLDDVFPGRWIGRGGPLCWPPRSPDLTPCDFFLWGFVKNCVYKTPVADLQDLRQRIISAFGNLSDPMLKAVATEIVGRWHSCIENGGKQVEKRPLNV